jgi:hypothetical protein
VLPGQAALSAVDSGDSARALTKTLTREKLVDGAAVVRDRRTVTVSVDKTEELRGRERINVSWSGARPSGGRAASPYGEAGLLQEYPVVIMQCRGLDDPTLPAAQQLTPETCWTTTRLQRTAYTSESQAVWRHDLFAAPADTQPVSGIDPYPNDGSCPDPATLSVHVTPFTAASGEVYLGCTSETMPPEAAVGAAFPAAEQYAFTDLQGNGSTQFEVRTETENESLGCSNDVVCSLVVIPIVGLSCVDDDVQCLKAGRFAPGTSNYALQGVDAAVSPALWWAESNWRNRFVFPLTFGLPPDACDVLDPRAPTGFYGSELMTQASLQWAPAYCLSKARFKYQHNTMADAAAFSLMEKGEAVAAMVSRAHQTEGTDPIGYAPTAVTGFSISYIIDRPDNAGEFTDLRLNARLLAKLLTQSYPGSPLGAQHPGMATNPLSINLDPEFQALNPGLDERVRESGAALLALSEESDVIATLTDYIAQDADAMAFIAGKPDAGGMTVNPNYKDIEMPVAEWPLLDTFIPTSNDECRQQNPSVYFNQLAAPVTSLRKIAEAVLDAWPYVQTRCDRASVADPWKVGRVDRQSVGARFLIGITSLGDAARYGLRSASLHTVGSTYVGPTQSALVAALKHARQEEKLGPFVIDQKRLADDGSAYPGTMIVHTASRLSGLKPADAAKVALFIKVSTSEGQEPGSGNGRLPEGFVPIVDAGATRSLVTAARQVAAAVKAQQGIPTKQRPTDLDPGANAEPPPTVAEAPLPVEEIPTVITEVPTIEPVVVELATVATTSRAASSLMGLLGFVGGLALAAAVALRLLGPRGVRP